MVTSRYSVIDGKITDNRKSRETGLQTLYVGLGPMYSINLKGSELLMKKRGKEYFDKGWDVVINKNYMSAKINVEIDANCNPLSSPDLTRTMGSYKET